MTKRLEEVIGDTVREIAWLKTLQEKLLQELIDAAKYFYKSDEYMEDDAIELMRYARNIVDNARNITEWNERLKILRYLAKE